MKREASDLLAAIALALFVAAFLLILPAGAHARPRHIDANGNAVVIGGRPAGCPHAYCGCGLRKYLGIDDPRLNLAWAWAKLFPRTTAHAGAAAVRHGHVMLLERHVNGSVWVVRDYNSGHGLSRVHERNVRGYVFVQPGNQMGAL